MTAAPAAIVRSDFVVRVAGCEFHHGWVTQCDVCGSYALLGLRLRMPILQRLSDGTVRVVCVGHQGRSS